MKNHHFFPLCFLWSVFFNFCHSQEVLWQKQIYSDSTYFGLAQAHNGTIIAAGRDKIYAINNVDGTILWELSGIDFDYPSISPTDILYIQDTDYQNDYWTVKGIDISNGNVLWTLELDEPTAQNRLMVFDDNTVYAVTRDPIYNYTYVKIDGATGDLITKLKYSGSMLGSRGIDDKIIAGLSHNSLGGGLIQDYSTINTYLVIDRHNGQIEHAIEHIGRDGVYVGAEVTLSKSHIHIFNGEFGYTIDPENYSLKRKTETGSWGARIGSYDIIYYVDDQDTLQAFNTTMGAIEWSLDDAGQVVPLSNGDVLLDSVENGGLHYIDTSELTTTFLDGNPIHSPKIKYSLYPDARDILVGKDGTIYVNSFDGTIYAINGNVPVGDAPWPMFGANAQRTFTISTDSASTDNGGEQQSSFPLQGWTWVETYPWVYNEPSDTWFWIIPINNENWIYNATTEEWSILGEQP
jgi:outer membrane protein assembly factor BamB